MKNLEVEGISKRYPTFHLRDVSFGLGPGYIMGDQRQLHFPGNDNWNSRFL